MRKSEKIATEMVRYLNERYDNNPLYDSTFVARFAEFVDGALEWAAQQCEIRQQSETCCAERIRAGKSVTG